jgi:BirA family transcriptional regulator, biotin operon repressor / biotin---[acetyl-CoA-carboxylase] ligase
MFLMINCMSLFPNFAQAKNSNLLSHHGSFNPIGQPFTILESVDSTNNYAMGQAQAGLAQHGAAWFAYEQTAGKGQRNKQWLTNPSENILLSVVLQPFTLTASEQFLLSASVALACYDFYKNYAGDETAIKWPNDLYWRDRKAGGILIENNFRGSEWVFAIAGIGININQTSFPPPLPNPVSLKQVTGKHFDVEQLARELCSHLDHRFRQMHNSSTESILRQYEAVMYKRDQVVKLKKDGQIFSTIIRGVSPSGKLIAGESQYDYNEVEWVMEK